MTEAALVEGQVKLRDGKKWKTRWLVLRKPSPVADCLLMLAYKDKSERAKGLRERSSLTLEGICGLEPGLPYEGLAHTLAIVCLSQAVMLGFDSREAMCAWDARIRYALGEVHRFPVIVAPGTKLESGPATLHLCNDILVVARDVPPAVAGQWKLSDLRRYGAVPNGFIFEGGTRGRSLLPVLCRGRPDQLSVRLHCPRHLAHQGPLRAAACSSRPEPWGPRPGGKGGAGGPGSPAAGEAAQPPLSLRPAGQWRGRPQRVQLVVRGQPLGRQRQQPARAVAGAVLVFGQHVAGGPWAGGCPGLWGRRAGRCQACPEAAAAAAAAGGRPPELLGQRHRHWQPLLLLRQLLVVRGQQLGRVAGWRRVRLPAQPAGGRGPRAQPVRLPTRGGRVPGARRPAAALRHAPQPAPGAPGPAPRRAGQPRRGCRPGLRVSPWLAWRETAGTGARGGSGGGRRALGSGRPPRWAPSRALFRVSCLRRTEGKAPSLRVVWPGAGGRVALSSVGRAQGQSGAQPAGRAASWAALGRQNPRTSQHSLMCVPGASTYLAPPLLLAEVAPAGGPSFEQDPEAQGACWLAAVCSWDPGTSVAHSQRPLVGREGQGLGSRVGSPRTVPPPTPG